MAPPLSHPGRWYGCFLNGCGFSLCRSFIACEGDRLPRADCGSSWLQSRTWRCSAVSSSSPDRKWWPCSTSSMRPLKRATSGHRPPPVRGQCRGLVRGDFGGVRRLLDAQPAQRLDEAVESAGGAVAGHHALGPDAVATEPAQGAQEEGGGGVPALVRQGPRHGPAVSHHRRRHARHAIVLGPVADNGSTRPAPRLRQPVRAPATRWPGLSNRPSFLMSGWISSPGRARWKRRTGSGGSIRAGLPNPSRRSQRGTVGRARPSSAAVPAPVRRRVRRKCTISATASCASRSETRVGALARFWRGWRAPRPRPRETAPATCAPCGLRHRRPRPIRQALVPQRCGRRSALD